MNTTDIERTAAAADNSTASEPQKIQRTLETQVDQEIQRTRETQRVQETPAVQENLTSQGIQAIEQITQQLMNDERNRSYTDRGVPPIFQISPEARILIIAQAPGKKVEETGIPFNDQSGVRLMEWLGIDRETFYSDKVAIMPMDFYYPGKARTGDLPPRSFVAKEYHPLLLQQMPNVSLTILGGGFSTHYYLKGREQKNLTETVRHFADYLPEYFPIVHPSPLNNIWLKKNPWFPEEIVPELQRRVKNALEL